MTVAELIEELKKYPQDLVVASFQSDCPNCGSVEPFGAEDICKTTSEQYDRKTFKYYTIPVLKIGY